MSWVQEEDSREARRMGASTGAARSSAQQMVSTVFNVDPAVRSGRMGGDDDDVQHKPHRATFQPPQPFSPYQPPSRAPTGPLDVSDYTNPAVDDVAARMQSAEFKRDVETILEAMRSALRARGAVGIRGLSRNFQICDTDGSRKLDRDELKKCLRLCKITLQPAEFDTLFIHADSDGSGLVDYDEFLKLVRGRLSPLRRKLVVSIFNAIDKRARSDGVGHKDGKLTADDLRDFYSAKDHPEVKAGKRTESSVLVEMLSNIEGKQGNRDGVVTLEEWIGYYEEISASIDNDDHFNMTLCAAWSMLFDQKVVGGDALSKPVPASKLDAIEKILIDAIRIRSSGSSETRALETTFKQFDLDKNGTIEFSEFRAAMERFGLVTGGHTSVSGCTVEVLAALFDRYDPDGSGALSYDEFIKGIFKLPDAPASARPSARDLTSATGTSLPLPSERGDGGRPSLAASHARGRGGVTTGCMNSGAVTRPAGAATGAATGVGAATGQPLDRGSAFNKSSGIFR